MIADNLVNYLSDANRTLPALIDTEQVAAALLAQFQNGEGATFNGYFGLISEQPLYAVSIYPERSRVLDGRELSAAVLKAFLRENQDLLRDPRHGVGIWYDEEEDQTYLDVSVTLPDRVEAVRLGQQYNQRGIYDFVAHEVVSTGGTGAKRDDLPPVEQRLPPLER